MLSEFKVKRHKTHENLVQLHYDQLESSFGNEIVQVCVSELVTCITSLSSRGDSWISLRAL